MFAVKGDYHIINRMDVGQDPLFFSPIDSYEGMIGNVLCRIASF